MEEDRELRRRRKKAFVSSLAEIRLRLSFINAILILLSLGNNGERLDYALAGAYLVLSFFGLFMPACRHGAIHGLRTPFLLIDLTVASYMIAKTGGADSPLYPFLFFPVLAAIIYYHYAGVFLWSSLAAALLTVATFLNTGLERFPYVNVIIKIAYLYGFGIFGSYIIRRIGRVAEEASEQLSQWSSRLEHFTDYAAEITASSELDEIFVNTIKAVLHNDSTLLPALALFEGEALKIYEHAGWTEEWLEKYRHHSLCKNSFFLAPLQVLKEPLLCSDIAKHPELTRIFAGTPIRALYGFPIVIEREVAGVLLIADTHPQVLDDRQVRMMMSIANQCGKALQQIVNFRTVKTQADRDGLTGLFNRRYFDELIEKMAGAALQINLPLSLILIDVDNFKEYNDTYGHPAGDQLLKTVAAIFTETVREDDIVARYGGEEFVVILWNTDNQLAMQIAGRIREAVARRSSGMLQNGVTISAGVATMPDQAADHHRLIDCADKSLYHAKHMGKNRVYCSNNL